MYVRCDVCGYDSGDRSSGEELSHKVIADGGAMEMTYEDGKPAGWIIACPNRCGEEGIHLD